MNFRALTVAICTLLFAAAAPAHADTQIGHGKNFGIGLEGGQYYQGLSAKLYLNEKNAVQVGGALWHDLGMYVHGEYLMALTNLVHHAAFELPLYAGVGAGVGMFSQMTVVVSGHLGVAVQLAAVPIDIFVEWTPGLFVVPGVHLYLDSSLGGVRWHF